MKLLVVCDESSKIVGHRYLNSQISFYIGIIQFGVCMWATAQHVFSIVRFKKVLHCDFVNGTKPVLLVGVDIIIFDIGLFHSLWGIDSCVAQHLDGGYGRFTWCICHILALLISLPFAFVSRPRPCALWPLLVQQSAYGVGLLILSLSALPRILPIFTGDPNSASLFSLAVYVLGTSMNSFLLYVYWHWYWHVESMWNSAVKLRPDHIVINPNMRTKRTMIKYAPENQVMNGDIINPTSANRQLPKPEVELSSETSDDIWHISKEHQQRLDLSDESRTPTPTYDEPEKRYEPYTSKSEHFADDISARVRSLSEPALEDSPLHHKANINDHRKYKIGCRYYEETPQQRRRLPNGICPQNMQGRRKLPLVNAYAVPCYSPCWKSNQYSQSRRLPQTDLSSEKRSISRRLLPLPPHLPIA